MARDFVALVGAHADDASVVLESSGGLLVLGMIIMSLSIISMVIYACISDGIDPVHPPPPVKPRRSNLNGTYTDTGGGGCCCGGGGRGQGSGGGCGGGGCGGGCGG
ncbi:hypothetical protein ACB094_06G125900 [Castanea mollissima]